MAEKLLRGHVRGDGNKVPGWSDADSFNMDGGPNEGGRTVRIWGIDGPEKGQPVWTPDPKGYYRDIEGNRYGPDSGGWDAADKLTRFFLDRREPEVLVVPIDETPGKGGTSRVVGVVAVDGDESIPDLGKLLVERGLALPDPDYSGDKYSREGEGAKQRGEGYYRIPKYYQQQIPKQERTEFIRRHLQPNREPWGGREPPWRWDMPWPRVVEPWEFRAALEENRVPGSREGPAVTRDQLYPPRQPDSLSRFLYGKALDARNNPVSMHEMMEDRRYRRRDAKKALRERGEE